jgi:hypothetical protein
MLQSVVHPDVLAENLRSGHRKPDGTTLSALHAGNLTLNDPEKNVVIT